MATEQPKQYVPLTCHGHSRPVTHISYSKVIANPGAEDSTYYLISACKDNNPMLRDGLTGDWIGTFFKHKGAVYQARLSANAESAATASADFTARVWDTHTGEETYTLQHHHIVRAVAFPPLWSNLVATGGMEKKLRVFDLDSYSEDKTGKGSAFLMPALNFGSDDKEKRRDDNPITIPAENAIEIGAGVHKGTIKAIVWTQDPLYLITAADDKIIRWWDLSTGKVVNEFAVQGEIGSCEFTNVKGGGTYDIGGGDPVLTVAAGNTVYFFGGPLALKHLKSVQLGYDVASVALHPTQRKFVTGGIKDTWVKVYDYDSGDELDVHKGHHGPIWSISFSPDGKLYATGSEDGTIKMWKNCEGPFGLWGKGT